MIFTKHALERLKERYNLTPCKVLKLHVDDPDRYYVLSKEKDGSEIRQVIYNDIPIKYVTVKGKIKTFLPPIQYGERLIKLIDEHSKSQKQGNHLQKQLDDKTTKIERLEKEIKTLNKKATEWEKLEKEIKTLNKKATEWENRYRGQLKSFKIWKERFFMGNVFKDMFCFLYNRHHYRNYYIKGIRRPKKKAS